MQKSKKTNQLKNDVAGKVEDVKNFYSNGVGKKETKVTVEASKPDLIKLDDDDANTLRSIEQNSLKLKVRIADIEMAMANMRKEKDEAFVLLNKDGEEFVACARKFAVKGGINPDGDASGDKWNLDTTTMVFHKVK